MGDLSKWLDEFNSSRPKTEGSQTWAPKWPGKDRAQNYRKAFRIYPWPGHTDPAESVAMHFHGKGQRPTLCPTFANGCTDCMEAVSLRQHKTPEADKQAESKDPVRKMWFNAVNTAYWTTQKETYDTENAGDTNKMGILQLTEAQTRTFLTLMAVVGSGGTLEPKFKPRDKEFQDALEEGMKVVLGPSGMDVIIEHKANATPKDTFSMSLRRKGSVPLTFAPNDGYDLADEVRKDFEPRK